MVERYLDTVEVSSSTLLVPTIFREMQSPTGFINSDKMLSKNFAVK